MDVFFVVCDDCPIDSVCEIFQTKSDGRDGVSLINGHSAPG